MNWKDRIKKNEGLRLKPYKDTIGKLTIGYGRNLDDRGITKEEADYLAENDFKTVIYDVTKNLPWILSLDEVRQGVIYEMCFNLGINRLMVFRNTLNNIRDGNYIQAAKEMLNSKWATQVGKRATELAELMINGA